MALEKKPIDWDKEIEKVKDYLAKKVNEAGYLLRNVRSLLLDCLKTLGFDFNKNTCSNTKTFNTNISQSQNEFKANYNINHKIFEERKEKELNTLFMFLIVTAETLDYFDIKQGVFEQSQLKDCIRRTIGFCICDKDNDDIQNEIKKMKLGSEPDRTTTNSTLIVIKGSGDIKLTQIDNQLDLFDAVSSGEFKANALDYKEILHYKDVGDVFHWK